MLLLKYLCILSVISTTYEQLTEPDKRCPKDERGVCKYEEQCPASNRLGHCGADSNYVALVCCIAIDKSKILKYYTARELPDRTQCGRSVLVSKISNGNKTTIGEYPWMAALLYLSTEHRDYGGVKCGGTLITEKFVLTAAHCVIDQTPESIRVLLGDWDLTSNPDYYSGGNCDMCTAKKESAPLVINATIDRIILHEFYRSQKGLYDIALLRLETPAHFTDYVRPVCLPTEDFPVIQKEDGLRVAGWGATDTNSGSNILLQAQLNFLPANHCMDKIQTTRNIHNTQFCAYNLKSDACQGDSGGPLMKSYKDKHPNWFQLGIVGAGYACNGLTAPSIYTRVSSFIEWIIYHTTPKAERDSRCITPDNKNGTCVLVSECPVLEQQYLQPINSNEVELVRRSLCGDSFEDGSDLVCCLGSAIKRDIVMEGSSCKTPKPEPIDGKCVSITNCRALKNASKVDHEYMLKSQCGFDDELLVCCKMQDIVDAFEPRNLEEFPSANIPNRTICGQIKNDSAKGEYPWLAAFMYPWRSGSYFLLCGGSLINARFVLTTATCLKSRPIASYRVLIGTESINEYSDCHAEANNCAPHMQNLTVDEVILHPFYHEWYSLNDIALARLGGDVKFNDYSSPVCLPPLNLQPLRTGSEVIVAGWGTTPTPKRDGYGLHTIVNAKTGLLDAHICFKSPELKTVHKQGFCTPNNYSLPFCKTASGGAIMKVHKDQRGQNFFLEGISLSSLDCTSYGFRLYNSNVRISSYTSWIVGTIENSTRNAEY